MKLYDRDDMKEKELVTPLVGVWIEIFTFCRSSPFFQVTPLVGVWIEIIIVVNMYKLAQVTPLVGVWIEIIEYA